MTEGVAAKLLASLGCEPFDPTLTGAYLHQRQRAQGAHQASGAGGVVVGAGNIYACEALFMAGIDPRLPAGKGQPAPLRQIVGRHTAGLS